MTGFEAFVIAALVVLALPWLALLLLILAEWIPGDTTRRY